MYIPCSLYSLLSEPTNALYIYIWGIYYFDVRTVQFVQFII